MSFASGFSDLGSMVSDIFAAQGSGAEASSYATAEQEANEEARTAIEAARVQVAQQNRLGYRAVSAGQAAMAANGLSGGSGLNIMQSSEAQSSLQAQNLMEQGDITSMGYTEQATSLAAQEEAAKKSQKGSIFGSILSGIGAVAAFL